MTTTTEHQPHCAIAILRHAGDPSLALEERCTCRSWRPRRYGLCTLTPRDGTPLFMLHDQTFADWSYIEARGRERDLFLGCQVEAERAARRWPLGNVFVVRFE